MAASATVLCVFMFIGLSASVNETLYYGNEKYSGLLTPECVANYYRTYVTKWVPRRHYKYFHEVMSPAQLNSVDDSNKTNAQVRWRIVGGNQVSISDIPYQVMYGRFCGGSLIAPEWVITAAHCKADQTHVYAGSSLRSKTVAYRICAHFVHPKWEDFNKPHFHDFDYQLVLLEKPVPINDMARPIAIGSVADIQPGTVVSVSGWGHKEYKRNRMEDSLRRVYLPIMPRDICKAEPNSNYHTITSRMFCAGYQTGMKDSCQGDSGGPAVVKGKLVGLVSFGVGCAMKRQPGVYSNIPLVRSWIRWVTALPL